MELSKYLREYSRTVEGKQQMIIAAFAKALEIIPRQLCDNAGFDATDILNRLRMKHAQGKFSSFFLFLYFFIFSLNFSFLLFFITLIFSLTNVLFFSFFILFFLCI